MCVVFQCVFDHTTALLQPQQLNMSKTDAETDAECSFRSMGCCFTETITPCRCETSGCKNFACLQCCFLVRGISLSEDGKPLRPDGTVDPFLSTVPILCESCTRLKDADAIKKYYKHVKVLKKRITKALKVSPPTHLRLNNAAYYATTLRRKKLSRRRKKKLSRRRCMIQSTSTSMMISL